MLPTDFEIRILLDEKRVGRLDLKEGTFEMKKKLSLLLVMIMAMTMIWGTGITAMAATSVTSITITVPTPNDGSQVGDIINGINLDDGLGGIAGLTLAGSGVSPMPNENNYIREKDGSNVTSLRDGKEYTIEITIGCYGGYSFEYDTEYKYTGTINIIGINPTSSVTGESGSGGMHVTFDFIVGGSGAGNGGSSSSHVHSFQYGIIYPATKDVDGLEGEVCSCGATRNTQPISAMAYALYDYALPMINAAKPGQTITFEFKEWNSFPRAFMEKIAAKSAEGVTFVFHYNWNHVKQEITIPAGTEVSLEFDWNGPAKMEELYGLN